MKINFKEEVLKAIHDSGHGVNDIDFITTNGLGLDYTNFWKAADFTYNNSTGEQFINPEFRVTFKDRTWIGRKLSQEREFFKFRSCLDKPVCFLINVQKEDFTGE